MPLPKDGTLIKLGSLICGTAILVTMLITDGPETTALAIAVCGSLFGLGAYLGKRTT